MSLDVPEHAENGEATTPTPGEPGGTGAGTTGTALPNSAVQADVRSTPSPPSANKGAPSSMEGGQRGQGPEDAGSKDIPSADTAEAEVDDEAGAVAGAKARAGAAAAPQPTDMFGLGEVHHDCGPVTQPGIEPNTAPLAAEPPQAQGGHHATCPPQLEWSNPAAAQAASPAHAHDNSPAELDLEGEVQVGDGLGHQSLRVPWSHARPCEGSPLAQPAQPEHREGVPGLGADAVHPTIPETGLPGLQQATSCQPGEGSVLALGLGASNHAGTAGTGVTLNSSPIITTADSNSLGTLAQALPLRRDPAPSRGAPEKEEEAETEAGPDPDTVLHVSQDTVAGSPVVAVSTAPVPSPTLGDPVAPYTRAPEPHVVP